MVRIALGTGENQWTNHRSVGSGHVLYCGTLHAWRCIVCTCYDVDWIRDNLWTSHEDLVNNNLWTNHRFLG